METLLQAWFDTSLQGVAYVCPIINSQGKVTTFRYKLVNAAFARILQQTKDELTGQVIRDVFPPTQENDVFLSMETVFQTGKAQQLLMPYLLAGDDRWLTVGLSRVEDQLMINIEVVSEQKKTEQELQRRLCMESIVSRISSRLISLNACEMDAYIPEALEQISIHIGAGRASIFLYSEDFLRGSFVHEWCAPGIPSRKAAIQNEPISNFAWTHEQLKNGQLIRLEYGSGHIETLPPEATQEKNRLGKLGIHSMIAIPLVQEGVTKGFIGFFTFKQSQAWDQNDVSLLKTFASLIASVFQRLEQEAAIRRANQRLEGLHAIDQALLSYRLADQPPLLIAMKYLHFMVPSEQITVFQLNEGNTSAVAKCRVMHGQLDINPTVTVSASYFFEEFEQDNQLKYYPDLQPDKLNRLAGSTMVGQGFHSLVIVPLFSRNECIGALTLASALPNFFIEEYLQIIQELASSLAIVLYQQQLDEQLKQYTDQLEQRVNERTREIRRLSALHEAILKHAGQAIVSTDIHGVVQTANKAYEPLLGYRPDELIGHRVTVELGSDQNALPVVSYQFAQPAAPSSHVLMDKLVAEGFFSYECIALAKDGRRVPILLTASSLQGDDGAVIGYVSIATDISALKNAEIKLQQKNQELNTIFEGAIDLHCVANGQGAFLTVNQAWELTLGYSVDELHELTLWSLVHPDEHMLLQQGLNELTNRQPIRNQTNLFRKKDGFYCVLEWNAVKINQLIYVSARDITERQRAEGQLRNLNQRLQMATQASGQGIWEVDIENDQLILDDRMREIYGLTPSGHTLTFQDFLTLVHPDDRSAFLEQRRLDSASDIISNVTRIIRPDGNVRYVKASGRVIRNKQGIATKQIGVLCDITEQKIAEQALRDSEQKFREIAENVDEVFWIHSAEPFRLLYLNPAFERVWNISFCQLRKDPFLFIESIVKEDQAAVLQLIDQYKAGKEGELYFRLQKPGKPLRWLFVRTFIIHDASGKVIRHIGIISDVTSQKEKEIVLQKALHREQELNQLKSQFVSTASHEFRTPLATIQSSVDLIRLYVDLPSGTSGASINKHLGVIEKEIEQFSGLLTDILTIGTIESGKISFNPRWVDVVSLCEELIATHFNKPDNHRRVLLLLEGTPGPIYLDDKLMSHVIVNLLSNALKFSTSAPCLHIVFECDRLVIQVVDEGIGIPAKELSALFQAFFRASNTSGIPGTGLGLVIARQFVELHGGNLTVQSEEKKGTTCTVTIPIGCVDKVYSLLGEEAQLSQLVPVNYI